MQSTAICFLIDDDIDDQEVFIMALKDISRTMQCVTANDYVVTQAGLTALKSTLQQVFQKHNSI